MKMDAVANPKPYFVFTPNLQGRTVRLRPLLAHDFERLYAVACDPLIWEQHPSPNQYQRQVFTNWFLKALKDGALIIEDQASGKMIGSSRYYDLNEDQTEVAIGYTFLARTHWGGKTNRELKQLMLAHAFATVKTVWFHIGASNLRSQKAIERIGATFSHEGIKKVNGKNVDYVFYRIDKALIVHH